MPAEVGYAATVNLAAELTKRLPMTAVRIAATSRPNAART